MPKKLLIIEDDLDIQQILHFIFTAEGYEVVLSGNGDAASELAVLLPDLILMDVQLKEAEKNGDAICRHLKSQLATQGFPVILLSAEADLADICKACSADAYLAKPFDVSELTGMVRHMIGPGSS